MLMEQLVAEATFRLRERGFLPLDEGGGERYGVWEWTWVRSDSSATFFVSLCALERQPDAYDIEVWSDAGVGIQERLLLRASKDIPASEIVPNEGAGRDILTTLEYGADRLLSIAVTERRAV